VGVETTGSMGGGASDNIRGSGSGDLLEGRLGDDLLDGHWQVLGSSQNIPLAEMVKLDYLYVANWSLWGDSASS